MCSLVVMSPFDFSFHRNLHVNGKSQRVFPSVTRIYALNRNADFRNKPITFIRISALPYLSARHLAELFKTSCLLEGVNVSDSQQIVPVGEGC